MSAGAGASSPPGPLAGRAALVTGGGRGIGAAVARSLAGAGAAVVVTARSGEEIERVAAELRAAGARAHAFPCDVTDESQVARLARSAREAAGEIGILVNNAGAGASAPLRKIALRQWNEMLAANATSTFLCTREFAPAMVERKWGRVVNVASRAGLEGARYVAHYSAAKHAVVGFTRSVARELAGTGVTVNAICPGYVDTPMTARTIENVGARTGLPPEEALAAVLETTGQERLLRPEEVAAEVLALCREEAAGRTGEAIGMETEPGRSEIVNPASLGKPTGWSHGILARRGGRLLFVAGQAGWERGAAGAPPGFAEQFARALDKTLQVVRAAGGEPRDVARMTVYVTDLAAYRGSLRQLGESWRARFGNYYPAMALVEVAALVDQGALVEIEATAVVGGG